MTPKVIHQIWPGPKQAPMQWINNWQDVIDILASEFPGYSEEIDKDVYDLSCNLIRKGIFQVYAELN